LRQVRRIGADWAFADDAGPEHFLHKVFQRLLLCFGMAPRLPVAGSLRRAEGRVYPVFNYTAVNAADVCTPRAESCGVLCQNGVQLCLLGCAQFMKHRRECCRGELGADEIVLVHSVEAGVVFTGGGVAGVLSPPAPL
jgi:hypothetical protein